MSENIIVRIKDPKIIWQMIIDVLANKFSVSFTGNNPYHLIINDKEVFVYIRNLTRAYPDHSPNVCRIQLHRNDYFNEVKTSEIPFFAIGYCEEHNTISSWLSETVKPRLNGKGNVSLYCRFSEMVAVEDRRIRECVLRNREVVRIVNLQDINILLFDNQSISKKVSYNEEELFSKVKDTIRDVSELKTIQIIIDYYERNNLNYDLIQIKNLILKFKLRSMD